MHRKVLASAAAVSLVSLPIAAQALPARLPAATAAKDEQLVGLLWQYVLLPVLVAVVIAAVSGGGDEEPNSP